MTTLPLFPAIFTDMAGSVLVIVLTVLSLRYAYLLTRREPDNFLWGFLFYFCVTLTVFAISRAMGHLVKQVLLIGGHGDVWHGLAPFSGGLNTLLMISLSAVIVFYHKGVEGYQAIRAKALSLKDANAQLNEAADQLRKMNLHLEERVEARTAELSDSEKKFRHFFTNSMDMVYFCNAENRLVNMNRSGLEMLGYPVDDPPPLGLVDLFLHEEELDHYFDSMLKDGFIRDQEVEFVKADGSVLYVHVSANGVFDESGKFTGCEGIAKDLTRVKLMMGQLAGSEKMASVGQMAAGVAHEINTPLGVILGYAQLMMDDFDSDTEERQNLEVIERQTKACRKIVADLLKFSRQSESAREQLSLNEVIGDVMAVTEHTLNMNHITVHRDLEPDLPLVIGDAEKLRQVLVNFINNAHHAMEESGGGDLYLETRTLPASNEVAVMVRDTGHGIPEKIRAQIFDPFFTTKSVGKGTGLGLSVSYGIIQEHGGRIEVVSPAMKDLIDEQSPGTAFHVYLPIHAEENSDVIKD
ncbi:MAG: PAS domain-containing protein [Desulfobulbaceae bacterium]|uniref:histidine kinase n=1 Tax=Candidatus Desulfatifera sulfidica TaxID=2841691 RepID=A0A8J6TE73_9BACT|nr:PAS domain-containing protein [Candidatus Desulfatifera sulfidica]